MNQDFALSKTLLRQAFRTNLSRDDHDQESLAKGTAVLSQRLIEFLKPQSGIWATFEPIGFEPNIRSAMTATPHITWAYPRVEGEVLKFYTIRSRDELVSNKWNILEPDPSLAKPVGYADLRGILIPGLAFDGTCNRLGRGRGYYDRTLELILKQNQHLQKIGIALDRQVSSTTLPHDPHDIAMDRVLTESRILASSSDLTGASERTSS